MLSRMFGRTNWQCGWAKAAAAIAVCAIALGISSPADGVSGGKEITRLRAWLREDVRACAAIPNLHFVALEVVKTAVPQKGLPVQGANNTWGRLRLSQKEIISRSRYEFWGDGWLFRIDYAQSQPGIGAVNQCTAWNGRQFQTFDPVSRILRLWPSEPRKYIGILPELNPILTPLEFAQPPKAEAATPWLNWLTFNRLRQHLGSILTRCDAVRIIAKPPGGNGLWGKIQGSCRGMPTIYEMRVSRRSPHLIIGVRSKVSRFAWSEIKIAYERFRVGSRLIWLPKRITSLGKKTLNERFKDMQVGERFPPSVYTIDFKQARLIMMGVTGKVINTTPVR